MNATATAAAPARRGRRVLVPLATLLAAGAVAVGSGATFTSTSSNAASGVTSGTLSQSNSAEGKAIFNLTDIKPGDTVTGQLTLKNTGSLDADFSLVEESSSNGFSAENLTLTIADTAGGDPVYTGTFGGLQDGAATKLGTFTAGQSRTYVFTVTLKDGAPNADQGKAASATYRWDSVQLGAEKTSFVDSVLAGI